MRVPKKGEVWKKVSSTLRVRVEDVDVVTGDVTLSKLGGSYVRGVVTLKYFLGRYEALSEESQPDASPRLDPLDAAYSAGIGRTDGVKIIESTEPVCECGADKVGSGGHSPWCPKFQSLKESA